MKWAFWLIKLLVAFHALSARDEELYVGMKVIDYTLQTLIREIQRKSCIFLGIIYN